MKKIISKISTFALVIATLVQSVSAQSDSTGQKDEYHIKIVKIDGNNKTELDTIVNNDSPFVWNEDTINPVKGMVFMSNKKSDSTNFNFNFHKGVGQDAFFITNTKELDSILETVENSIVKWNVSRMGNKPSGFKELKSGDTTVYFISKDNNNKNTIDLSDSGIISYKKKDLSNGREKITIVRKKQEKKEGYEKEIIIDIEDIEKGD